VSAEIIVFGIVNFEDEVLPEQTKTCFELLFVLFPLTVVVEAKG
jgi:hypothetical protein